MPELNIARTEVGNFTADDYSVNAISTDGVSGLKETEFQITQWSAWYGYYLTIPELKISIDAKSTWTVGKGFTSDEITWATLNDIKGFGKDSFNSILSNMIRTYHIGGDSFAEIIRDNGKLINLKPLDPSVMKIIANSKGVIIRYDQMSKTSVGEATIRSFEPEEMFHLSRNRTADEIHGRSMVESVEPIILMRNEAMTDYKKLLHRNVYPVRIWKLDVDIPSKVAAFKAKVASARGEHEDIFIPMGTVETEIAATPSNATLNPLPWIQLLNQYFFQATSVPQVIVGGSAGLTEAATKIEYLAFEQTIEGEQLYIEEQILSQLNLEINLSFPATLQNELISSKEKEGPMQAATNEDTSVMGTGLQEGAA